MTEILLTGMTLLCMLLVVYHHALYPLILRAVQRRRGKVTVTVPRRRYVDDGDDGQLPRISIVVPAHNEADFIAAKIHNLAVLDYPASRLEVILACDGCTDDTAGIARRCLADPVCADLALRIVEFPVNRGKVATLNAVLHDIDSELVALSDVSALVSVDALLIAAARFRDPAVGVVNSHYRVFRPGSDGEASYWNYQSRIKSSEAALGATIGAHGAFYLFRRHLFHGIAVDTINDDFVLPMEIVAQGYVAAHEDRITALELEQASESLDRRRRLRISAGNLQQLIRLRHLLLPRYRGVAFAFASGKALRVAMPFLMITAYVGSMLLAPDSSLFLLAAGVQTLAYGLAAWQLLVKPAHSPRAIRTLAYIISGHVFGLLGTLQYAFGRARKPWKRATAEPATETHGGMK